tara:strand:+ start:131 stop:430 length:300 start_codon:yes stop_codon:yes gene_type:complete
MNNQVLGINDLLNLNVFNDILNSLYICIVNRNIINMAMYQVPPPDNMQNQELNINIYLNVLNTNIEFYMNILNQHYNHLDNAQMEHLNVIRGMLNNNNN